MNIFFDARWTRLDHPDGVTRYSSNLAKALSKLHNVTLIIHDQKQLKLLPQGLPHVVLSDPASPKELFIAKKLNRLGADVVFSPMQLMGSWGRRYKLILTLHDVIYYQYRTPPFWLSPPVRLLWWLFHLTPWPQRLLLNQADCIVTVSETSKRQIKALQLTKRPIVAVLNAPTDLTSTPGSQRKVEKTLIFNGAFTPYKNPQMLIKAVPLLPDYKLHLISPITADRKAQLEQLAKDPSQIKFWDGVTDEQYADLLDHATALVSASKFEGFGLPLAEAMQRGVPVICSDIEVFHEVTGPAGLYFDPTNPDEFAHQVRSLEDPKIRHDHIEKGLAQVKKFSWDQSAEVLLGLMQKLYNDKSHRSSVTNSN